MEERYKAELEKLKCGDNLGKIRIISEMKAKAEENKEWTQQKMPYLGKKKNVLNQNKQD